MGKLSSDVKDFKVETIQAVTESKDSIHDSLEEMVEIVAKTGNMVKEVKKGVKDAKLNAKTEAVEARLEKTQELLRLVLKFLKKLDSDQCGSRAYLRSSITHNIEALKYLNLI